MWTELASWQKALAVLLPILGPLAVAAGVMYLALLALPHFFPAYSNWVAHGMKNGIATIVVGVPLLAIAVVVRVSASHSRSRIPPPPAGTSGSVRLLRVAAAT